VLAGATPQTTSVGARLTSRELFDLAKSDFVYDPTDAAATGRLACMLGRLTGVVCVEIAPGDSNPLGALALGILERLGKDLDREKQIRQRDAWRLARVWLDAEEIQALIVIGADLLDAATWKELADVCRQTDEHRLAVALERQRPGRQPAGAAQRVEDEVIAAPTPSVILIQHQIGVDRTERDLLSQEGAFRSVAPAAFYDWAKAFQSACERARNVDANPARREKRRFPAVPDDEIPYFRGACRAALSTPDFRVVDAAYRKAYDSTASWLYGRQRIAEDEAGAFLATKLSWISDVNEQLTRLRGAQVAFLRHWWLLKVDVEALAAAHSVDPLTDIDDDVYDQLRRYMHPKTSALAALAIATRLGPGRLAMLNADQVFNGHRWHQGYNTVDLGDQTLSVGAAYLFLRAHHFDRELRDEPADGPLFTTSSGKRLTAAGVQQQLRAITRDIGLPLVAGWSASPARQHTHWMHRRGLTLQAL